jgi:hypothetical protein
MLLLIGCTCIQASQRASMDGERCVVALPLLSSFILLHGTLARRSGHENGFYRRRLNSSLCGFFAY